MFYFTYITTVYLEHAKILCKIFATFFVLHVATVHLHGPSSVNQSSVLLGRNLILI